MSEAPGSMTTEIWLSRRHGQERSRQALAADRGTSGGRGMALHVDRLRASLAQPSGHRLAQMDSGDTGEETQATHCKRLRQRARSRSSHDRATAGAIDNSTRRMAHYMDKILKPGSYRDPQERSEIRNQIREWQAGR